MRNQDGLMGVKSNYSDSFELLYIRHGYFRRSTNPEPKRLASFEEMICNISDKIYLKNIDTFKTTGMEMEDLRNISRVHTVSFLSMCGLKENHERMEQFIQQHKTKYGQSSMPTERDIFLKECYNLARFLDQRIQEVAKFCKAKNNNIRGTLSKCYYYASEDIGKKPTNQQLVQNPELYGFFKISKTEYLELVKICKPKDKNLFTDKKGRMIVAAHMKGGFLSEEDVEDSPMDFGNNSFYRSPEENLLIKEMQDEKLK